MSSHCKDSSTSRYLGAQPDPEGSGPSPQREPSEGNNSPSSSLVSDPWPSGWLAAESLKRPFPPSRLRAQVRNWVTHCFLRRTFLHFCQGPRTGSRLPGPGRSPAHATHSPAADRCLRVSVQLSTSWAPGCQRRVEGEGQEPQGCPFPSGHPHSSEAGPSPQSSCRLWASWAFGLPASTTRRHDMDPRVVSEEQDPGAQNTNGKTTLIPCWHMLKWRDGGNGTFSHIQTHCACLCSFGKPFSPFQ